MDNIKKMSIGIPFTTDQAMAKIRIQRATALDWITRMACVKPEYDRPNNGSQPKTWIKTHESNESGICATCQLNAFTGGRACSILHPEILNKKP